jgi:hypothetical protein
MFEIWLGWQFAGVIGSVRLLIVMTSIFGVAAVQPVMEKFFMHAPRFASEGQSPLVVTSKYLAANECKLGGCERFQCRVDCKRIQNVVWPGNQETTCPRDHRVECLTTHMSRPLADTKLKRLADDIPYWSETLRQRTLQRDKIIWKWLGGRSDLIVYVESIVDCSYLGWMVFCTVVSYLCQTGRCELFDQLHELRIFRRCLTCYIAACKPWKLACRTRRDKDSDNMFRFNQQYIDSFGSRFDLKCMRDTDDRQERLDYWSSQRTGLSFLAPLADEVAVEFKRQLWCEGVRFAEIVCKRWKREAKDLHPVFRYLMGAPTGSMPAYAIPECVKQEIPESEHNKKMSYAGMTEEEANLIDELENSISSVEDKIEPGKLRSLVIGSLGLFDAQSEMSAVSESEFLATLFACPLLAGTAKKRRLNNKMRELAEQEYACARDYGISIDASHTRGLQYSTGL